MPVDRSSSSVNDGERRLETNLQAVLDERLKRRDKGGEDRPGLTAEDAHARLTAFLTGRLDGDVEVTD